MGRVNQVKTDSQYKMDKPFQTELASRARLNLNDLLKKRNEEKKIDKKINLVILSGAAAITVVIFVILSL